LAAIALPVLLWRGVVVDIWASFRLEPRYFVGWTPWLLMAAGLACFVPVALTEGRDPEGRFYPRSRNALLGWGVSLYLLGFLLAWQVARIHDGGLTAS
jgi:hypothetical protein